jgi:DNA-binding response OmpR family regulator
MQESILIADDEKAVRESVATALRREGFAVGAVADGEAAWESLAKGSHDLAILDISMPLLEGTAVLARVRAARMAVPVIFLTSRDEEIDRIAGLESGADDYISKPFSMGELLARVRAVLRRAGYRTAEAPSKAQAAVGNCPSLRVHPEALTAYWNGTELQLTLTEFRMLDRLCHRSGEVVTRAQLMECAFPLDNFASERSADSHIKRLRKKLVSAGAEESLIETMYGAGYRLKVGPL